MIAAIIQARMSSTRLPGKILQTILGAPMLLRQIERVRQASLCDALFVATSTSEADDSVAQLCESAGVACFRGSLDDVLDRYYRTALTTRPDHVVRLTGDCPLIDPEIIDAIIRFHVEGGFQYTSNTLELRFPDGLDVEVMSFTALERAWREAKLPSEREHVTRYMYSVPGRLRTGSYVGTEDWSHLRWTVDELEDLEFVRRVYSALYPANPRFRTHDILELLERQPELSHINSNLERNEGLRKSLAKDEEFLAPHQWPDIAKSLAMQARAQHRIPGMTQLLSKHPHQFAPGVWPGYFSRASGVDVWDLDGNRYIDMSYNGIGACVLGAADPDVDAAVRRAIDSGTASTLNCAEEVELADLLCELHPWAEMARFARTGGEAMAIAVRVARAYTGRDIIAFCGYHGWHDWYLAANLAENSALDGHLLPGLDPVGVPRALAGTALPFRYNCLDELKSILENHRGAVAAVVMEPIRDHKPEPGFLKGVRELATHAGAALVIDEVSAGFRLNCGGAHLTFGIAPDIAVFSKALGNGYPAAAIIGRRDVMQAAQRTFISSTNWTERIGSVAALATVRKHRDLNVAVHLIAIGERVQAGWKNAAEQAGLRVDVGGIPPLAHFLILDEPRQSAHTLFTQLMLQRGYLASRGFYATLAHSVESVDRYVENVCEVFVEVRAALESGCVTSSLRGSVARAGFARLT
jgi:glutamate-1-semialdehyde 2,1-aminomutase